MASFSEQLRSEAQPVWDQIFRNPFLREAKEGRLPVEKFRFYLIQDFHYLEAFARTVAIALGKAPDSEAVEALAKRVLTPIERPLHRQLLELVEVSPEEAARTPPAPTNLAYANHMLVTAHQHGLGPTAAALLPCPWTYHLLREAVGRIDHPVYGPWSDFYAQGMLEHSVEAWRGFVDQAGASAGPAEREAMRRAFLTSSRYELMFWEMAYRMEQWPG
ncbi:MAG: thiaminase II [Chloroflexi bacterium]|nr:thiaminase II [Chloroflexota bacterium]